jgi:proteic killer suppression protein
MIQSFGDHGTEDVFNGKPSRSSRKTLPVELHSRAFRVLDYLNRARSLNVLKCPPSNHLETLRGDLQGFWSIRINSQWRVIFQWHDNDAWNVKIVDYH